MYMAHCFQPAVDVHPSTTSVTIPGGNLVFICTVGENEAIVNIQWLMNDSATLLNESLMSGKVMVDFLSMNIGILSFTNITLEFNFTRITCNASLQSGKIATSDHVIILLQGESKFIKRLKACGGFWV